MWEAVRATYRNLLSAARETASIAPQILYSHASAGACLERLGRNGRARHDERQGIGLVRLEAGLECIAVVFEHLNSAVENAGRNSLLAQQRHHLRAADANALGGSVRGQEGRGKPDGLLFWCEV